MLLFGALVVTLVSSIYTLEPKNDVPAIEDETLRIVGGKQAKEGQYPYAAALYLNDEFICTASIISETAILTAAHCVVFNGIQMGADAYYARVGSVDRSSPDAVQVTFSRITVHPDYRSAKQNDIAILETTQPIAFSKTVQPICIASPKVGKLLLKKVTAMGWGYLKEGADTLPDNLQHVEQKVVCNLKCSALYFFTKVPDTVLCASGIKSGVCGGDSGGPLVYKSTSSQPVQVGVAAFVNNFFGCGTYFGPAGFTRVSSYTDFIMKNAPGKVCVAN